MTKSYKFSEIAQVRREFNDIFKIPMQKFYDGLMSVACKSLQIDIVAFDEWLSGQKGYNDNKSIMDNLKKMYGAKAVTLIDNLTSGGDDE